MIEIQIVPGRCAPRNDRAVSLERQAVIASGANWRSRHSGRWAPSLGRNADPSPAAGAPRHDRPVLFERQVVVVSRRDGNHPVQTAGHGRLAIVVGSPGGDRYVLFECQTVIAAPAAIAVTTLPDKLAGTVAWPQ